MTNDPAQVIPLSLGAAMLCKEEKNHPRSFSVLTLIRSVRRVDHESPPGSRLGSMDEQGGNQPGQTPRLDFRGTNAMTSYTPSCPLETHPIDDHLPLRPKHFGETIVPMQPGPAQVEIQHFPTVELDDADGVVCVLSVGEFGVSDREPCGEDSFDLVRGGGRVGVAAAADTE